MVMALVLSTPAAIIAVAHMMQSRQYAERNANSVTRCCMEMFVPAMRRGSTAFGCSICLNSFCITFNTITQRMLLKPPLVLPEHAPINMQSASSTHVTCGHLPTSSLKSPVVVMNDTTWKIAQRKAYSRS